jgi:hypothetical protein
MRTAITLASMLAASSASAGRGFGILVPPAEVDVGAFAATGDAPALAGPSSEVLAGVHWASLFWKPTRFDVGIGYVGSFRPIDPSFRTAARIAGATRLEDELRLHGMYMQLGSTLVKERHYRAWVAARGELMKSAGLPREISVSGAALRVAAEVYKSGYAGSGRSSNGVALVAGTVALGVYVEAMYRDLPSEYGATGVATGISLRVPFMLVAVN